MKTRLWLASRLGQTHPRSDWIPGHGLRGLMLVALLVMPLAILAQVSAVDLADWGQDKAAPRPGESAPGEIKALDTKDEEVVATDKAPATKPVKPRVAVYQFKVRGDLGIPDAGDIIGEWMIGALAATGRFTLMERVLLQKVFEENELQSSHLTDESSLAAEAGRLYGVEAIVSGTALKWGETISIVARLIVTNTGVIRSTAEIKPTNRNNIPDQIDLLARKLVGPEPAPSSKASPQTEAGLVAQNPARLAIQILPSGRFRLGQEMRFRITSQQEGHLLVVDLNAAGELSQVYPMDQGGIGAIDDRLRPGRALTLPEPRSGISFSASEPTGTGRLIAILTGEPLVLDDLLDAGQGAGAGQDPVTGILERLSRLQGGGSVPATWSLTQAEYLIVP